MKLIPSIIVPVIENNEFSNKNLFKIMKDKRVIIFGVPGAFTPTCSEKHLPGFLKLAHLIKKKNIHDIYCLSVNDPHVMKSWLLSYDDANNIKAIADGNGQFCKSIDTLTDKSMNFMGIRCVRFAAIIENCVIKEIFIEDTGMLEVSTAEFVLSKL